MSGSKTKVFGGFSRGPGGFRELREAGRNHFHLSRYLSDTVVTSYGQKSSWGEFVLPSTVVSNIALLDSQIGSRFISPLGEGFDTF